MNCAENNKVVDNSVETLKKTLSSVLVSPDKVTPPEGLATGSSRLDDSLLWKGLPKSAISLFHGACGRGATSLWAHTALKVTQTGKWAAWINAPGRQLCPWTFQQGQADLSRLVISSAPQDRKKLLWMLQELMSVSLFETIGCDMGDLQLRDSHLLTLKRQARRFGTALVLITEKKHISPFYSLVLGFESQNLEVQRALHRPTPYTIERRNIYADFMPQLAPLRKPLSG